MEWALACVSAALAVEVFLRTSFNNNIAQILDFMKRSGLTIRSAGISDHWKEKVLPYYALKIFINSLRLLFCMLLTVSPVLAVHYLANPFGLDLLSLMTSVGGIVVSIIFASLYILFRTKILDVGL